MELARYKEIRIIIIWIDPVFVPQLFFDVKHFSFQVLFIVQLLFPLTL